MHKLIRRFHYWIHNRRAEEELDQELEFHRAMKQEELERSGLPPIEAAAASRRALGNVHLVRQDVRAVWVWPWFDRLWQDIRYAIRMLSRSRGTTAIAVLSLGVGIGATTAVYSTIDWLLNRPPAGVVDPDRLVTMRTTDTTRPDIEVVGFSYPQYEEVRRFQNTFLDVATYGKMVGVISNENRADQDVFELVSGNYFALLGLRPALGRFITPDDDREGVAPVAVLSYNFWQSHLGGDSRIVGRTIRLNGQVSQVIGITPRGFDDYALDWNGPTNVWVPVHAVVPLYRSNMLTRHGTLGATFFSIVGRLKPRLTFEVARQQIQAWPQQLVPPAQIYGPTDRYQPNAIAAILSNDSRIRAREETGQFFASLLVVCSLILFAACFNIANFLLGRAVLRRREMAVRVALGATGGRLLRQLLTEALLIGIGGSALGFVISVWLVWTLSFAPRYFLRLPLTLESVVDLKMLGFAMALGLFSAFLCGLVPALLASFRNPIDDLKNPRPHWTWGRIRITSRQIILAFQVALSVAIAVTAGLYARSFAKVALVDSGYKDPASVLIARVIPNGMTAPQGRAFYAELLSRLNSMPQVASASMGWNAPFRIGRDFMSLPGSPDSQFQAGSTAAGLRLFETLGVPIVAGREFIASDDPHTALVINRILAQKLWPDENPIGRSVIFGATTRVITGVVAEERCRDLLGGPQLCAWQPFPMSGLGYVQIRTKGDPMQFAPVFHKLVHELNQDVALSEEGSLDTHVRDLTAAHRISAMGTMALAIVGLVLLAIGCISLFLSMVRDSVREIAIRIALGANNAKLTMRIVSQGMLLTVVGVLLGIGGARFVAERIADQLYRTEPTDPITFAGTSLLIIAIMLLSVFWSARIATKTDPAKCLRAE